MDFEKYDSIQLLSVTEIIQFFYQMQRSAMETSASQTKSKNGFNGILSEDSAIMLAEFCEKNQMSSISQALAELLMLLEWRSEKKNPAIQITAIYNALLRLEKVANKTSCWEICGIEDYDGPAIILTDFEMEELERTVSAFIVDLLCEEDKQVLFFPLTDMFSSDVIVKWRILGKIASIKLTPEKPVYKQKLTECIVTRIKNEVANWLEDEFQNLKMCGKSTVLKDAEALMKILKELKSHVTKAVDVVAAEGGLFEEAECNYFESLSQAVDEKTNSVCKKVMESMDIYQQFYKSFHVNMRDSCALSHALYLHIKKLVQILKVQGEMKQRLEMEDYDSMFPNFFVNLLQVMKSECHNRITRAVEVESKDTVNVEEKILSSSVIVLNCFCTVIDEWKHLEIENEEVQTAYLVKTTDIICDGAKIFAESLERRLWNTSFHLKEFDFPKKACLLANSIEHVRKYLEDLPVQMQWSETCDILSASSDNDSLKEQVLRILNLIHQSMNDHLKCIILKLFNTVASGVQAHCEKVLYTWLQAPITHQSFDRFLSFYNEYMESLHKNVKVDLFPRLLSSLWSSLITYIQKEFQEGQPPEYAKILKENIQELKDYFLHINMDESDTDNFAVRQFMISLDLNSKSTVELQLEYYSQVAESIISPVEYLGHIAFQAGYKTTGRDLVDLYINVQKGQRLPARKFVMNELCVKVELCPNSLFPNQSSLKSPQVTEDLDNPVFNEFFSFSKLPSNVLSVKGAVIQVLILNQDNSYTAEAVLLLNQVQNMSGFTSFEFLPVYLMPLRKFDMSHVSYQILENRSRWDKNAKIFIASRLKLSKSQKKFSLCIPGKNMMCHFASNDD